MDVAAVGAKDELPLVETGTGATFLVRAAPPAPSSLISLLMRGRLDAILLRKSEIYLADFAFLLFLAFRPFPSQRCQKLASRMTMP